MEKLGFTPFTLILMLIISFCSPHEIDYHLSNHMIDKMKIHHQIDSLYYVMIKLNVEQTKQLTNITSNNIGKIMRVYINNEIVTQTNIVGEISSGVMLLGGWKTKQTADKYLNYLKE